MNLGLSLRAYGVSDFRTRPVASVHEDEMTADVHALAIDADDHASRQAIVEAAARWPVFPRLAKGRPLFAAGGPLQPFDAAPRLRFALSEVEIRGSSPLAAPGTPGADSLSPGPKARRSSSAS
jgi:hypothetical protein